MKLKARGSKPHAPRELMGRCEGWTHDVAKRAGTKKSPCRASRERFGRGESFTKKVILDIFLHRVRAGLIEFGIRLAR
ncbi:MAG: hypothetical protein SPK32_03550, partial [Bacteroidaceae bacterium]|nr:hypothetical protein [Bacteroidaceae bacterium]